MFPTKFHVECSENIRGSSKRREQKEAEFARALAPSFSSLNELLDAKETFFD